MADGDTPTADEIEASVLEDVANGVQSFSDGTNSVTAMDPEKRLAVARKLRNDSAAASNPSFGLRNTQLRSPAGGFR